MHLHSPSTRALSAASLVIGASAMMFAACSVDVAPLIEDVEQAGLTWEEFRSMVYEEPGTGVFIVNGDEPVVGERALRHFYEQNFQSGALIVATFGGVDRKWSDAQKQNITYCIGSSFGANKQNVVNAMASATAAWAAAANNQIKFVYASAQDAKCTSSNANVQFDVNQVSGQAYLARAFFPGQSRATRNILIDTSSFGNISPWTLTGVLTHELGHALGFRHEHTRPEAGMCFEDNNWRELTTYDSASVMHYPQCNGTQAGDLTITQKDKDGVRALYAPSGCAHDKCSTGAALNASVCGPVVSAVCAADSFCCDAAVGSWDSACVSENRTIGKSLKCSEANGTCSHSLCAMGAALTAGCDSAKANCVATICAADPFCCGSGGGSWDLICVGQVASKCGKNCN